jgi:transcriptional regulator with XRE-family HTH domain
MSKDPIAVLLWLVDAQPLPRRVVADRAGIHYTTLNKVLSGVHRPTPATLDAVLRAIGRTRADLER